MTQIMNQHNLGWEFAMIKQCFGVVFSIAMLVHGASPPLIAQDPIPPASSFGKGVERIDRPRWPGGKLTDTLGEYLTIEGVRAEEGKVGTRTLVVDTLNGRKLRKPVYIWVENLDLPFKKRCVLKGYETGAMIGEPPAAFAAAKEQGKKVFPAQATWQWRAYFVVLIVKAPADLKLKES